MPNITIPIRFQDRTSTSLTSDNQSEKAAALAKHCSLPCPPGDSVKAAIGRTADRVGIPFSRVRDIWYGDARRIDAWEMESLRAGADAAEVDIAMAGIEAARRCLQAVPSPLSSEAIASLDRTISILGRAPDAPGRRSTDRP
jgi:hypothetical protein